MTFISLKGVHIGQIRWPRKFWHWKISKSGLILSS